jgi:hypothetical protein
LLFKDIICFYVALHKEQYNYDFNENKNFSILHITLPKIISHQISQY